MQYKTRFFFFNDTATTEIYTLSLHDALPIHACWTFLPTDVAPMPSMVVMAWPTAALTGVTHDRRGMPSRFTVQAPHSAAPQPNLVPVMPSRSRKTHSRGMSGGASTV